MLRFWYESKRDVNVIRFRYAGSVVYIHGRGGYCDNPSTHAQYANIIPHYDVRQSSFLSCFGIKYLGDGPGTVLTGLISGARGP